MIAAFCRFFIYLCDGSILAWGFWGPKNFLVLWRIAFPAPEYATDDAAHISIKLDLRRWDNVWFSYTEYVQLCGNSSGNYLSLFSSYLYNPNLMAQWYYLHLMELMKNFQMQLGKWRRVAKILDRTSIRRIEKWNYTINFIIISCI